MHQRLLGYVLLSGLLAAAAASAPPAARGQEDTGTRYRFKAVYFGKDEREATRRLNELDEDGWEYVGPLANGLVAFKQPVLTLTEKYIKAELEKLQGTWTLQSYETDGAQQRKEDRRCSLTVKGDRWAIRWVRDDGTVDNESGTLSFVTAAGRIKRVDLIHGEPGARGKTSPYIYRLQGDLLTTCVGKTRPTEFATQDGDGRALAVWRKRKF